MFASLVLSSLLPSLTACAPAQDSAVIDLVSDPIPFTLGTLFISAGSAVLYDDAGIEVARSTAGDETDGYLPFQGVLPGIYYLDVRNARGQTAYGDTDQLEFAPAVIDGDAEVIEGPFELPGVEGPLLMLRVGDVADEKSLSVSAGSTSARLRVTWEASYAMGGDFAKGCNSAVSCWNYSSSTAYASGDYASDDTTAWSTMRSRYGTTGNVSCKDGTATPCYIGTGSATASSYTYQATSDSATKRYRLGQCKFAQNLILYRSGQYTKTLPSDATISADTKTYPTATTSSIAVGDVLRKPSGHSVLVVAYDSAAKQALVVDSNYSTGDGHEALSAHTMDYSSTSTSTKYWSSYRDLDCVYNATPCGS